MVSTHRNSAHTTADATSDSTSVLVLPVPNNIRNRNPPSRAPHMLTHSASVRFRILENQFSYHETSDYANQAHAIHRLAPHSFVFWG